MLFGKVKACRGRGFIDLGGSLEETQRKKDFSRVERDCFQAREKGDRVERGGSTRPERCCGAGMMDVSMVICVN